MDYKKLKIYDNQGKTFDRFTILALRKNEPVYDIFGMSANPLSPQGFNQYCGETLALEAIKITENCGIRIPFNSLEKEVQQAIKDRFTF